MKNDLVEFLINIMIAIIALFLCFLLVYDTFFNNHPILVLEGDKWTCTKEINNVNMIYTGNGFLPYNDNECLQYTKK